MRELAVPGIDVDGGYAEHLKTFARSVVKIDDALKPADVATLADASSWPRRSARTSRLRRRELRHVLDITGGYGAEQVIDIPTIDIISTERNIIGNLVGTTTWSS